MNYYTQYTTCTIPSNMYYTGGNAFLSCEEPMEIDYEPAAYAQNGYIQYPANNNTTAPACALSGYSASYIDEDIIMGDESIMPAGQVSILRMANVHSADMVV
jgi:hypothetical protein